MTGEDRETFIDVGHFAVRKDRQNAPGDVFISQKNPADGRVIATLSDGLGSGVKACVLASLTATMASKFVALNIPIKRAAEIIMNTLPVCRERGISYATFTLIDIAPSGAVKIIEYDNPPCLLIRDNTIIEPVKEKIPVERKNKKTAPKQDAVLSYSAYTAAPGDRLVFFSDGVTQSGMGSRPHPFGWGIEAARRFIQDAIAAESSLSARDLATRVVREALLHDAYQAKDDISCAVVYFRRPRDLLVVSGPPVQSEKDRELARAFAAFHGAKIIAGGTTANIISRELGAPVQVVCKSADARVPPLSRMEGADLVTEGIITLGIAAETLGNASESPTGTQNAADKLVEFFLNSDRISFMVGTKINEAHQDPTMPVELEIRRNVVKKIAALLEAKYLKEVRIQYV